MLPIHYFCRIKLSRLFKLLYFLFLFIAFYILLEVFRKDNPHRIILWWSSFMPKHDRLIKCYSKGYKCIISSKREYVNNQRLGAFLFYGSKIVNYDFPLPRNVQLPWAIFHEESPKNYAPFLHKETQDLFNITSTFSQNSDFPVTLQYLKNVSLLTETKYFISVKAKNSYLEQLSPVLYIQSDCDTPAGRDYLVKELSKYIRIDSYGSCLKNKTFPSSLSELYPLDLYNEEYMKFISKYKFILSFENAICEDYISEKIWRPLIVGSIPIYYGANNIEEWVPNKNSAILAKNFEDARSLAQFIQDVNQNDTLYDSFLAHKISGRIENEQLQSQILLEHPIQEFECYICKQIHEQQEYSKTRDRNIYDCPKPIPIKNDKNTWDQHWDIGKCQSKALRILIEKNELYTEETFENTWKHFYHQKECL